MSERVSHEKREGNCRIVYFPGTDSQSASLWNHEDCPVCRAERAEQRIRQLERERDGWRADAEREGKNVIFHRENHDESKRRLEEAVEMLVQLRDRLSEVACDADRLLAGVDAARAAAKGGEDD